MTWSEGHERGHYMQSQKPSIWVVVISIWIECQEVTQKFGSRIPRNIDNTDKSLWWTRKRWREVGGTPAGVAELINSSSWKGQWCSWDSQGFFSSVSPSLLDSSLWRSEEPWVNEVLEQCMSLTWTQPYLGSQTHGKWQAFLWSMWRC